MLKDSHNSSTSPSKNSLAVQAGKSKKLFATRLFEKKSWQVSVKKDDLNLVQQSCGLKRLKKSAGN
jgi:hypothetical protein